MFQIKKFHAHFISFNLFVPGSYFYAFFSLPRLTQQWKHGFAITWEVDGESGSDGHCGEMW